MIEPNPSDLESMRNNKDLIVQEASGLMSYLAMNTTKKPFNDVRVRKH